jgi:hypothetical protein
MILPSLHLNTLTMNVHPDGSLRWQRFTGLAFGRFWWGRLRDCAISNEAALAEYGRAQGIAADEPRFPASEDEIYALEERGAMW